MSEHSRWQGLATKAIHAGFRPDPQTGAVNAPIYASSTFAQDGVGGLRGGFEYARTGNPTRAALEASLAAVEEAAFGRAFSSGMAATDCALRAMLRPGDHVVMPDDAYGGTFRLIDKVFTQWGIDYTAVALADLDAVRARDHTEDQTDHRSRRRPTRCCPSPTSAPSLSIAAPSNIKVLVDNTFASPALQQPLVLGADIVLHSTTKYIGGHSDVVGGALLTNDEELDEAFGFLQNGAGAVPGPFDAYLTMRGLKTLVLRMQRHSDNAALVAEFLDEPSRRSRRVLYPGLPSHPGHEVAARQMSGIRRHGVGAAARRHRGRARILLAHRGFHPRRVAGRRGVADRASRRDDARVDRGLATRGARRPGPAVGGHRGRRRTCSPTWSRRYVSAGRIADAVTARFISGSAVSYSSTQLPLAISLARM